MKKTNSIISIDPSINNCGFARFKNKKLVDYRLLQPIKLGEKSKDHILKSRVLFNYIAEQQKKI